MRNLYIAVLGALVAGCLTFAISGRAEIALLAAIECSFIGGALMLICKLVRWRISPYLLSGVAVIVVTFVSLSADVAP